MDYLILSPNNPIKAGEKTEVYQMRRLRFRKIENLPSVRWLASDRAKLKGC